MTRLRTASSAGFTLMEVLIAFAILAVSLAILIGTQANSVQMNDRANRMSVAAMLARGKMFDIESELLREGFSTTTQRDGGTFREEGFEAFRWTAEVEVVEISGQAEQEFVEGVTAQLYGDGESDGVLSGASAVTQFLPMIIAQIPQIINDISERTRRIVLTVEWDVGGGTQSFTLTQFVVNIDSEEFLREEGPSPDELLEALQ
ncbi:MAG: prepilin-type N-terminal cleavage/methylation domain-containing protein [Deltaproteobacteria bacterium]|nr:MAG: prepilin-type N-terminal cleavage/methylation domain-containing protein [Deltaproteobacteria bacterium]